MQRLAFRKIFNQFSHISYLLLISFTTKFELQKSNYFCGFNINASEKKIILSLSLSNKRNFVPYPCHTTRSGFFFKVGSIPKLDIKPFKQLFWQTTLKKSAVANATAILLPLFRSVTPVPRKLDETILFLSLSHLWLHWGYSVGN